MKYAVGRSHQWIRVVCAVGLLAGLVALLVSVPVMSAIAAPPVTYYVDAVNGSNSNDGTSTAEPFKTITKALSYSNAGGTVMIKPGVYDEANGETFPLVLVRRVADKHGRHRDHHHRRRRLLQATRVRVRR